MVTVGFTPPLSSNKLYLEINATVVLVSNCAPWPWPQDRMDANRGYLQRSSAIHTYSQPHVLCLSWAPRERLTGDQALGACNPWGLNDVSVRVGRFLCQLPTSAGVRASPDRSDTTPVRLAPSYWIQATFLRFALPGQPWLLPSSPPTCI